MNIASPCVVSLSWRLEDAHGQLIDELVDPVEFFYGGDDLLPKVEQALAGQAAGFAAQLHLEPEHAFGDYDAELVFFEDRALFDDAISPGMQFDGPPEGATTEGLRADAIYTVTEVYPNHVVFDGNHPLAGIALRIDVTVRAVRDATAAEIEAGTVDPPVVTLLDGAQPGPSVH